VRKKKTLVLKLSALIEEKFWLPEKASFVPK
jgi:hypothetical protein